MVMLVPLVETSVQFVDAARAAGADFGEFEGVQVVGEEGEVAGVFGPKAARIEHGIARAFKLPLHITGDDINRFKMAARGEGGDVEREGLLISNDAGPKGLKLPEVKAEGVSTGTSERAKLFVAVTGYPQAEEKPHFGSHAARAAGQH